MAKILVFNSGSATLKFKIYCESNKNFSLSEELSGIIERIGLDNSFIEISERGSKNFIKENFPSGIKNHAEAVILVLEKIKKYLVEISYVGHRVVHGGADFVDPTLINSVVLQRLRKFNRLAPLHTPINLTVIEQALKLLPDAKQYAIFDTAYYKTLPEHIYLYPLPWELSQEQQIRRYGFHGISHKYAAQEAAKKLKQPLKKLKIVSCHLGSGASMTATKNGEAMSTTMGFTPLAGLMMSTRCGDIDPAIPLYLINEIGLNSQEVDNILNKKSGLLGVAGTMDMREVLAAAGKKVVSYKVEKKFTDEEKKRAEIALKMFVYNIVRYVGQLAVTIGGIDALVFTGGIGERSPIIRQLVVKDLKALGKFKTIVIPANEELMIAREIAGRS